MMAAVPEPHHWVPLAQNVASSGAAPGSDRLDVRPGPASPSSTPLGTVGALDLEVEQSLDLRGLVKNMLKAWREVGGGASWRPRQQDVPRMCTLDEQRHYDERRNDEKKISATAI